MTFIDTVAAFFILGIFLSGFSQSFLPVYTSWSRTMTEYNTAHTMYFVSESFRRECSKPDMNIERWKNAVASANELESYEISELKHENITCAYKAVCVISGERLEIIGERSISAKSPASKGDNK